MQVETYEVEPLPQNEMQALAEDGAAALLIDELGLNGQKHIMGPQASVIPYRRMTEQEHFAFATLFSRRCAVEEYKDGPIPLRVLQVISHVRGLEHKDLAYLQVWHPAPGMDDPVLVARPSAYEDPVYLLARWGQALQPLTKLVTAAKAQLKIKLRAELTTAKQNIDAAIATLDSKIDLCALEGRIPQCYITLP